MVLAGFNWIPAASDWRFSFTIQVTRMAWAGRPSVLNWISRRGQLDPQVHWISFCGGADWIFSWTGQVFEEDWTGFGDGTGSPGGLN